ncbi:hypothetical protein M0R04_07835 [Candidatus Dojkabacteria bacterium]|nr:hypothetical protein [Candidatus Dojkabacteria bacterium]
MLSQDFDKAYELIKDKLSKDYDTALLQFYDACDELEIRTCNCNKRVFMKEKRNDNV